MWNLIKESYVSLFKNIHRYGLIVLPLLVFSAVDDYAFETNVRPVWQALLAFVVLALTQIYLTKYILKFELKNVLAIIKRTVAFAVYQFVLGAIMFVPVYVFLRILAHHQIDGNYLFLGLLLNLFLGNWFLAKFSSWLVLIAQGEKFSLKAYMNFSKQSYLDWLKVSALVYFPYVLSVYFVQPEILNMLLTTLFLMLLTVFNCLYYQSKK